MEKLLYGALYVISIPLWILYILIDFIDKNLLKKRKKYVIFQELFFLFIGLGVIYKNDRKLLVIVEIIVAEVVLLLSYNVIRKALRYLFKGIRFILFPFYYVIRPANIKKMDKRVYKAATGEDLDSDEWDDVQEEDLKIEQNEFKKVNSNSLFEADVDEVRNMLMADSMSVKNALYIFGFKKMGDITKTELKVRYHLLAKRFHSDNTKEDESIMKGINVAHEKLLRFVKK